MTEAKRFEPLDAKLPGAELVTCGLDDLAAGRVTAEALLVEIAAPRLRGLGLEVPRFAPNQVDAELRLYDLLRRLHPTDAYVRYNGLVGRMTSLALALARRRARRAAVG